MSGITTCRSSAAIARRCHAIAGWTSTPATPWPDATPFAPAPGFTPAAIIKALKRGDRKLADRVYSGVPANWFGREQEIEIGHMSGLSNVSYWLASRRIPADDGLRAAIFARAKASNRILTDEEVMDIVRGHGGDPVEEAIAQS